MFEILFLSSNDFSISRIYLLQIYMWLSNKFVQKAALKLRFSTELFIQKP